MLVYGECECFVMQMLYVCVLCASCGRSQCCDLHDLQFHEDHHHHCVIKLSAFIVLHICILYH